MTPPDPDAPTPSGQPGPATAPTVVVGTPRRRRGREIAVAALAGSVLAAGTAVWLTSTGDPAAPRVAARRAPVATPLVTLAGVRAGQVSWASRLSVTARNGTLREVRATGPDGQAVPGQVSDSHHWSSSATLLPGERYSLQALVVDAAGRARTVPLGATATPASKTLHARVSPGDGAVVGVGTPVIVTFDRPLRSDKAKAAVERRLSVKDSPAVRGAWHWFGDSEVHFRGPSFWAAGSRISVTSDLTRLSLPGGVWGEDLRTSSYAVGASLVSTVDVAAHTMTVRRNGSVLRVMPASMGRTGYPTKGGIDIVLEKQSQRIMDSSTVGHPKGTPDYYRELVKDTVRITNSGTFTHSAPWSVKDQGKSNVSHGCVNLSPTDGHWFFNLARRGDIVQVVNAEVGPSAFDAGSADWNTSFADWKQGSALA